MLHKVTAVRWRAFIVNKQSDHVYFLSEEKRYKNTSEILIKRDSRTSMDGKEEEETIEEPVFNIVKSNCAIANGVYLQSWLQLLVDRNKHPEKSMSDYFR